MKLRVLGCSGSIGGAARTSSFLIDGDILLDAGTGVGDLEIDALREIDHVFLTHAHLDHVGSLPLLLDTAGTGRQTPVTVYAQAPTLAVLEAHLFNNALWPDFSRIPSPESPYLRYQVFPPGGRVMLGGRRVHSIPVNHAVPGVGFLVSGSGGSIAYSGDTTITDEFWRVLNACDDLKYVLIETTFLDADTELARSARHLCPTMLAGELEKFERSAEVFITHLMPGREDELMEEIAERVSGTVPQRLKRGMVFEL